MLQLLSNTNARGANRLIKRDTRYSKEKIVSTFALFALPSTMEPRCLKQKAEAKRTPAVRKYSMSSELSVIGKSLLEDAARCENTALHCP